MAKASDDQGQGGLWDDPDIVPTYYIDTEAAREQRAASFAKFQGDLFDRAPMVSGHSIFLEVTSVAIDRDEIHLSYKVHGIVQRPGVIAVPASRELHHVKIAAKLTEVGAAAPEDEPAPGPETTADRIQHRSDLQ